MRMTVVGKFVSSKISAATAEIKFGNGFAVVASWLATEVYLDGELISVITDASASITGNDVSVMINGNRAIINRNDSTVIIVAHETRVSVSFPEGKEWGDVIWSK